MNRRDFLTNTAGTVIALGSVSITDIFTLSVPLPEKTGIDNLEPISETLNAQFKQLLKWMIENGWIQYLQTTTNADLRMIDSKDEVEKITKEPKDHLRFTEIISGLSRKEGFSDFAGRKLIEPGIPQLSLLYHALASPRIKPQGFLTGQFPTVEQLDTLENYIYALKKYNIADNDLKENYCLAVFAYEYRPAFKTPHHIHADMVFSRTGIGRVGERAINFDKKNRCWTNLPAKGEGTSAKHLAITPARFGLFLARKVKHDSIYLMSMKKFKGQKDGSDVYDDFNDRQKCFLQPVRKIFDHDLLIGESKLDFREKHRSVKIADLLGDPSLTRTSTDLIEQDRSKTMKGSSFLVISNFVNDAKQPALIRPVRREGSLVYLKVEDDHKRYFTSYNQQEVEDIELLDTGPRAALYRMPNNYDQGRNKPMYVNITHVKDKTHNSGYVGIERAANGDFEKKIYSGGYEVPLFEDGLCDGQVTVETGEWVNTFMNGIGQTKCIPAYSIVTAPDFFPQVDNFDLMEFDIAPGTGTTESHFYEGGVASLATCRIRPDPNVIDNASFNGNNINDTYTAVFCEKQDKNFRGDRRFLDPRVSRGYLVSGFLPDVASSVFAPGWDITYANDDAGNKAPTIYLSTKGLGSPFVEDMKLCSAMNGMWPAASPDASRIYQGSVTDLEVQINGWRRNPTAIPLLDEEVGIHKDSPCTDPSKTGILGWDGEQGPFLQKHNGKWHVNFTDLGRADYIDNALNEKLDASKLRELTSFELISRMACLKKSIRDFRKHFRIDAATDPWLVSAEKIDWVNQKQFHAHGIPDNLKGTNKNWARQINSSINRKENCYLFVFADTIKDKTREEKNKSWVDEGNGFVKRRRQLCSRIYVYQVTLTSIARLM